MSSTESATSLTPTRLLEQAPLMMRTPTRRPGARLLEKSLKVKFPTNAEETQNSSVKSEWAPKKRSKSQKRSKKLKTKFVQNFGYKKVIKRKKRILTKERGTSPLGLLQKPQLESKIRKRKEAATSMIASTKVIFWAKSTIIKKRLKNREIQKMTKRTRIQTNVTIWTIYLTKNLV